jgi:hypothetical protein
VPGALFERSKHQRTGEIIEMLQKRMGYRDKTVPFQGKILESCHLASEPDYGKRHDLRNFFSMNERNSMAL